MQPSPHKAASSGEKYAVVIGINTYRDANIPPLRYAGNDAVAMRDFLVHRELGGFKKENVHLLLDSEATFGDVRSQFVYWLGARVQDQDEVWIFFSGRATTDRIHAAGQPFTNYLIAHDTVREDLAGSAIALKHLEEWLDLLGAARTAILLDCGFSAMNRGRSLASGKAPALDDYAFLPGLAKGGRRFLLVGTGPAEISLEDADIELGLFSRILLQRLRTAALMQSGTRITWNEFYQAVAAEVAWHAEARNATQKPVKFGELASEPVFLPRYVLATPPQAAMPIPPSEPEHENLMPFPAVEASAPEPELMAAPARGKIPQAEAAAETGADLYQENFHAAMAETAQADAPPGEFKADVVTGEHVDELLHQAQQEARAGNLFRAQDILEKAIALDPNDRRAATGLRKIEEALRQCDRGELIKAAYNSALRYTDEKNYAEAVRYYAKVLEMDPTSESARLGIDSCRELLEKQAAGKNANGRVAHSRAGHEKAAHAHHLAAYNSTIWPYIGWVALLGCIWQLFSTPAEGDSTAWIFWKTVASGLAGAMLGLALGSGVYLIKRITARFEDRRMRKVAGSY